MTSTPLPLITRKDCVHFRSNGRQGTGPFTCKVGLTSCVEECAEFQGHAKARKASRVELPCVHLGDRIKREDGLTATVPCPSCGEQKGELAKKPLYACALPQYGQCTVTGKAEGIQSCQGCPGKTLATIRKNAPLASRVLRINLPDHFNCGIIEHKGRTILASRKGWVGHVALSILDENYQPIKTQVLDIRHPSAISGAEDPRLFVFRGKLHIAFTGYEKVKSVRTSQLVCRLDDYLEPERVWTPVYSDRAEWEKNWQFFEHDGELYSVYTVAPHVILRHGGETASAVASTPLDIGKTWRNQHLRGGAPPVRVGDEYYHWFHAVQRTGGVHRYTMGLYTFAARPPFELKRYCEDVLLSTDERVPGWDKLVVFPCGAMLRDGQWGITYGHQDRECRVAFYDAGEIEKRLQGRAVIVKTSLPAPAQRIAPVVDFPQTWCITCKQTPERGEAAAEHFSEIGLSVNFYEGIHGKTFGLRTNIGPDDGYRMPSGHVGLNLSYVALWQMLTHLPGDAFLILEDDAHFTPTFIEDFQRAYAELPADWQFVYVGHLGIEEHQIERITDRVARLNGTYPHGTQATLVRRDALQHLLDTNHRAENHIDQQLAKHSMPDLRVYAFVPTLAGQHSFDGTWPTIAGTGD